MINTCRLGVFYLLIKDLLKEFTFELQIKNYPIRTTETYNYNTTHFIQYLDEFHDVNEIEDISTVHVKKYIQHQLNLGKKATYINTVIKSFRSFYTYLVAEEYVTLNIMARTKLLKEDKTVISTFTDQEIAKMIEAYDFKTYLNARNKVIIAMFADTAIRCLELINLEVDWVDRSSHSLGRGASMLAPSPQPSLRSSSVIVVF